MNTKTVNIDEIKPSSFNPDRRTANGLGALRDSIEKHGRALIPLLVDKDMNLIDGHRRLACLKDLGIPTVDVSVVDSTDAGSIWSEVNTTTRRIGRADWTSAYLQGMSLEDMPLRMAYEISEMERLIGRKELARITAGTRRGGLFTVAQSVSSYVSDKSDTFMRTCILYMDKRGNQFLMRRAMASCVDPKHLRRIILANRPLRLKVF